MPRFWYPGHEPLQSHGVNWQTIIFIAGMMVMIEGLTAAGFFRWMCLSTAKLVNYRVVAIFVAFILLSGVLSMFIDSITVMLFLASVTVELGRLLEFDPIPLIIAEIAAANTGGAATMAGDPPNIIIGTAFGFSFLDFVLNTGLLALAGLLLNLGFFYLVFRKSLHSGKHNATGIKYPEAKEAITNPRLFLMGAAIFLLVIVLLITHAQTGISVALIGVIAAGLSLLASMQGAQGIIRKFDWRTILFFVGLFICVAGLEETGTLKGFADYIQHASHGNPALVLSVILWVSAFASSIIDNIPFAATMVPVVASLSQTSGISLRSLSWSLSLGTDIGGNGTPIGASANVVGTAIAEREGYPIGWGRFCKYAYPGMMLSVGLIEVLMLIRYV
jgi:Na+/H+ antiporter NhaD/arsenite permease-like protein